MAKTIPQAVREVCLNLPESLEVDSHGSPDFRVHGKSFATYVVNHHGDGRVALWLRADLAGQQRRVAEDPKHCFVPPYVGTRGWFGLRLDQGVSWRKVAALVREAYERAAPPALVEQMPEVVDIAPPTRGLTASELDPMQSPHAKKILARSRKLCLDWPETAETRQFGAPVWQVRKKTFVWLRHAPMLSIYTWVGVERQGLMLADERFHIPAYLGANGWIALDVQKSADWDEIRALALASFRHFAPKGVARLVE
jgi:hypothetical protein